MRVNESTVLVGHKTILVPYRSEHVLTYHTWMQNEELQQLTASEPLSLEEEYEMQRNWCLDDDKLTFIILAHPNVDVMANRDYQSISWLIDGPPPPQILGARMIGDVNMFLKGTPPEQQQQQRPEDMENSDFEAEIEIMIAEPAFRRKGYASDALRLFLTYTTASTHFMPPDIVSTSTFNTRHHEHHLIQPFLSVHPTKLVTRISSSNTPSISLFEKLGFQIIKVIEVFQEVEMRWQGFSQPSPEPVLARSLHLL